LIAYSLRLFIRRAQSCAARERRARALRELPSPLRRHAATAGDAQRRDAEAELR